MTENLLFVLLMIGFALMIREIYILTAIWLALKEMVIEKEMNIEKNKRLQHYAIETMFLTFTIVSILIAMFLFTHEGIK